MITVCLGFAIFKYSENGTMTVFAEGSIQGYADGSATDAKFSNPHGLLFLHKPGSISAYRS
jgi:hypothetical protein